MATKNQQINQFEISGKAIHVGQPESYVGKNNVTKITRKLVMEVFCGNYADEVEFFFNQSNMNNLLQIKDGDWVTISFCLKGTKSLKDGKARWYPKLEGLTCIKG
jgi:hypothetical protein